MAAPYFIVIEGIDGSGKTTLAQGIVHALQREKGVDVKLTFEPHDPSAAGIFIRQVLAGRIRGLPNRTLALAIAANRADHCDREINPFLDAAGERQRAVVCDRYYLSSLVYQRDEALSLEDIYRLNASARRPDLTIFMNASDRTCYRRMRSRNQNRELFEKNLGQIRRKYLEAIEFLAAKGEVVEVVAANEPLEEVLARVMAVVKRHAPDGLPVHPPLPLSETWPAAGPEDDARLTLQDCLDRLGAQPELPTKAAERPREAQIAVDNLVDALNSRQVTSVCLDLIRSAGYRVEGRIPWLDLAAFRAEYALPLGLIQRGAVVILGDTQMYNAIMQKLLREQVETLGGISDFLLLVDTNPGHLINHYAERDTLHLGQTSAAPSPAVSVVGREQIKAALAAAIPPAS